MPCLSFSESSESCLTSSDSSFVEKCHPSTIPRIESQNFILYEIKEECRLDTSTENASEIVTESCTTSLNSCTTVLEEESKNTNSCITITESSDPISRSISSSELTCGSEKKRPTILHYYSNGSITIIGRTFGVLEDGTSVLVYEMTNQNNMTVHVITYGARFHQICVPDKAGVASNVILSCESLEQYQRFDEMYLNATIGRVVGVVKNARFCYGGESYYLSQNLHNKHHNNGEGLHRINWESCIDNGDVLMTCVTKDNGYPGTMFIQARFQLTATNEIRVTYTARTTMPSPCNISNRIYFNLAGVKNVEDEDYGTLYDHFLNVNASNYTLTFPDGTPYKRLKPVPDTEHDLRSLQQLGIAMARHPDNGFDCLYEILSDDDQPSEKLKFVSKVIEPTSGRAMELYSTENFVWFSTCNDLYEPPHAPITPDYDLEFLGLPQFPKRIINVKGRNGAQPDPKRSLTGVHRASVKFLSQLGMVSSQDATNQHSDLTLHDSKQSLTKFDECEDEELSISVLNKSNESRFLKHSAFYLQPQNFPNAVNHQSTYPDIILLPGKTYKHEMLLKFGTHTCNINTHLGTAPEPVPNPCCEPDCPRKFMSRCCDYCDENCMKCSK